LITYEERLRRFEVRNSAENLHELANNLAVLIDLNASGVKESFAYYYQKRDKKSKKIGIFHNQSSSDCEPCQILISIFLILFILTPALQDF